MNTASGRARTRTGLPRADRGRGSDGSVLLLVPVAVLVVALLGGFAVDAAHVFARQRHAYDVALHAASDATGAGIDLDALRAGAGTVYDPDRVRDVAAATVAAAGDDVRLVDVTIGPAGAIVVTVATDVERIFHPALVGSRRQTIHATARAVGESRTG